MGLVSLITAFVLAGASVVAFAQSHARIVRLSYVSGQVQMDRATGQGLEHAILNTPVVQGTRLVTGNDGLAEVEFEDQSALRVAGNSEVYFGQLLINDAGAKVNDIQVVKGTVFLDTRSKNQDLYRVAAEGTSFIVRPDTQMRFSASADQLRVAVFKGDVLLENQPQLVSVKKNETLTMDPKNVSGYAVAKGTEALPTDAWNKERQAYDVAYAHNQGYGGPKSGYGLQDLNYYGSYFYAPGYGNVWQPYGFDSFLTGWNPYSNGAWMFYPGMGYTWASSYPWGWLPYHYGSWAFINGTGWAWLPGGNYGGAWYANNFQATPVVVKPPAGWTPVTAPASPVGGSARTILVGKAVTPAYVPGGRVPPNFASVIPGRTFAANGLNSTYAGANHAVRGNVFATSPGRTANYGHVFAAPPGPTAVMGPHSAGAGPTAAGTAGSYAGSTTGSTAHAASSSGHSSSGTAHH